MGLTQRQAKRRILELVERLSDDDLIAVEKFAEFLAADPALRAALTAPYDDEPLTPEDHEALQEADEQNLVSLRRSGSHPDSPDPPPEGSLSVTAAQHPQTGKMLLDRFADVARRYP